MPTSAIVENKKDSVTVAPKKHEHVEHKHQKDNATQQRGQFDYSVRLPEGATEKQKSIAKEIEEIRRKKAQIIFDIKKFKRRLAYKLAEQESTKKLAELSKNTTKNIGYLRRRKEQLEFRISTEAYTLEAEKDLIRKKNEIDLQLDEAIKSYRVKRKAEFIEGDISELNKSIEQSNKALIDIEAKLDELYGELRKLSGQQKRPQQHQRKEKQESKPMEVSLADIAIIKGKKDNKEKDEDSE